MLRYLFLLLILLLANLRLPAQHLMGLAGSNRVSTHAVLLNPSAIADSRQGFYLNLFTGQASFTNTYFHYDGPRITPGSFMEGEGEEMFDRSYIKERLDGKSKMAYFGTDLRLPSFMLKLSPRHSIALTTRFRTVVQANNLSENLARVIGFGTANADIQDTPFTNQEAYFNFNAFGETGLTYARVLLSREKRFLKGGITLKKLAGLYNAHLLVSDLDYQVLKAQDGTSYMRVQQGNARFGYTRSEFELDEEDILEAMTWRNIPGSGWGLDIGFTYEHRPKYEEYQYISGGVERTDHGRNKYKYRIGASLLDVGGISYKDSQHVRSYDLTRKNLDLDDETFSGLDVENLGPSLEEALEVRPAERQTTIRSGLPTALHLNVDYMLTKRLYLNTSLLHDLRGKGTITMRQFSVFTVAPRFESKSLELAIPVSLTNDYRDLALGAMLRLGPLLIGSNNLSALLGNGKTVGADLYAGLGFGFGTGGQRKKIERRELKKAEKASKKAEKAIKAAKQEE